MSEKCLTPESAAETRLPLILQRLRQRHPDAHCELDYQTPLQLLIATILSAQCTDVRVNQVTPVLFSQFQTAMEIAAAPRQLIEEIIRPTGFYRQKARFIQETAHKLVTTYDGQVPASMDALTGFPGVARKTANVVLGEIFGIAEGIVVDTHVKRLSNRLGLSAASDPKKVEQELMALVSPADWIDISHLLIFHGRRVCSARRPDCANCPLTDLCPAAFASP